MCDYWKDLGYDDGGEVCLIIKMRVICQADSKDCECPKLLELRSQNED